MWSVTPAVAAYLVVAFLVWLIGGWMVGLSPSGQKARLAVAIAWLPLLIFLAACGLIADIDAKFERALDRALGRTEDDDA